MIFRLDPRPSWVVDARPTPAVVLRRGDQEVASWALRVNQPDLALVDDLARLQLIVQRLGYSICVRNPSPRLFELLDLAGLGEVLGGEARSGRGGDDSHP